MKLKYIIPAAAVLLGARGALCQNYWQILANTHQLSTPTEEIVDNGKGLFLASGHWSIVISQDSGGHWQNLNFPSPSPGDFPVVPDIGDMLLVNGYVYLTVSGDAGDPYEYIIERNNLHDTTWNEIFDYQGDHMYREESGYAGLITTMSDSLLYYFFNQRTSYFDSTGIYTADTVYIYCVTPTRTYQPAFAGIEKNAINVLVGNAAGDLFAAVNNGVYISTDEGNHWAAADTNFADTMINRLLPAPNGNLYAITESGSIYRSADNGGKWAFLNDELHGIVHAITTSTGAIVCTETTYNGTAETSTINVLADAGGIGCESTTAC